MKNKLVIRARGGLGNQMFQFAYSFAIAKKTNGMIMIDTREYSKYYWPFGLKDFKLIENVFFTSQTKFKYDVKIKFFHLFQFIRKKLTKKELIPSPKLIRKGYIFSDIYCPNPSELPIEKDVFLYGYFQDVKYLLPIRNELCDIFSLKHRSACLDDYCSKIAKNSIGISIRFAEDIELKNGEKYIYSEANYYQKAIEYVTKAKGEMQLVIMSNDIKKARNFISNCRYSDNCIFIEDLNAQEQIEIFKKCSDFIISNSTFAWWGAFLGSFNKDSLVIVPKVWYQGTDIKDTHLFYDDLIIFE